MERFGLRLLCLPARLHPHSHLGSFDGSSPRGSSGSRASFEFCRGIGEFGGCERREEPSSRGEERDDEQKPGAAWEREDGGEENDVGVEKECDRSVVMTKPPRCELVQNKWMVENQTEKVEVEVKMNHVVYIVNCVGSHVVIKGKGKSVVMDGCKKTSVVFDSCLSTLEAVNCKQCKAQCLVNLHVAAIDKTDGFTLYVPRSCIDSLRITTSKSSDMNVSFPSETDDQDWIELPIPEQYVHTIEKNKLKTEVSDLYSFVVCCKSSGKRMVASPSSSVGRAPGS